MNETPITVWITKYALTAGILKVSARRCDETMIAYRGPEHSVDQYFHGKDWHTTEQGAIAYAEDMLDRKIHSLKKQIAKLEKLQIKTVTP